MRISDWSSDVCSSDLVSAFREGASGDGCPFRFSDLRSAVPGGCHGFQAELQPAARRAQSRQGTEEAGKAAEAAGGIRAPQGRAGPRRSEEHTSELQSLMRISYAVFCLKKNKKQQNRAQ